MSTLPYKPANIDPSLRVPKNPGKGRNWNIRLLAYFPIMLAIPRYNANLPLIRDH